MRRTDTSQDDLSGATLLSVLNQGSGVQFVDAAGAAGLDFKSTLTDGEPIQVDLRVGITTLRDVIDAIVAAADATLPAPGRLPP